MARKFQGAFASLYCIEKTGLRPMLSDALVAGEGARPENY
jgi:hypothetical protein